MSLFGLLVITGCQRGGSPSTDTGPKTDDSTTLPEDLPACSIALSDPDETGIPSFTLNWSGVDAPPDALTAEASFFHDGVTLAATYALDEADAVGPIARTVPMLPAERTDGQAVQEYFRSLDGGLEVALTITATWSDGPTCSAAGTVPFRAWTQIDEMCPETTCEQPPDLKLSTELSVAELDETVALSMSQTVLANSYSRAGPGRDNYTLALLPLTGTPLQFTRIGDALFEDWDSEHEATGAAVLNCDFWHEGSEVVFTQGYPEVSQAIGIVLDGTESVQGFSYTQSGEVGEEAWLHHNCFVDPQVSGDVVPLYALNWSTAEGGEWSSDLVRVDVDTRDGSLAGEVETLVEAAALTTAHYRYSNGLSLSPAGNDGLRWIGVSFANDNNSEAEREKAFFLTTPLLEDGAGPARFLFVNQAWFDPNSLTEGWQETFPELEIIDLPDHPTSGTYPIDFPHSMEFFQVSAGTERDGAVWDVYRLIVASLGALGSDNPVDGYTRIYQYDVYVPAEGSDAESFAEVFCGAVMPTATHSHFDLVLPSSDGQMSWVGAYTSEPMGALFWLDLWQTDAEQRCRMVGSHPVEDIDEVGTYAVPIWSTETDPVSLYGPMISELTVRYDPEVLLPSMP